jgi:hypothetical protein
MAVLIRGAAILAIAFACAQVGCYSPRQPPCAFSCAADGLCPGGYTCAADGVCHRDDDPGTCDIPSQIDAGDAGAPDDGGADGASGDDGGTDGP